jgi:methylisocitrate lyase
LIWTVEETPHAAHHDNPGRTPETVPRRLGQSKLLTAQQLQDLGVNIVIYPNTTFRLAMKAVEEGMAQLLAEGTQEGFIDKLQPRSHLYEILGYENYNRF